MAEVNINQIIIGVVASIGSPAFIFACYKIYQIFSKSTKVEIDKNADIVKLLITSNEKYFNEKFDAQNQKFDTFSKDIKKIVDKHDDKIDTHSETLIRQDDRLNQIEKDKEGIGIRLNDVCRRLVIVEQKTS